MPSLNMSIVILITHYYQYVPMVLAVFPKSFTIGTETHVSVNVRFHRKRIGFVLAFGSIPGFRGYLFVFRVRCWVFGY